jgi:serine O-acetyltransferase
VLNMKMSLQQHELVRYVLEQTNTFFPDANTVVEEDIRPYLGNILARTEHCFSRVNNKYFLDGSEVVFNHLHSDQYAMFLYFVSNTLYRNGVHPGVCTKIYLLNKYLHGIDAFYEVALPDVFLFVHPLGTVLGRGTYSDYFLVYQRCGIGSNRDEYPIMKDFVTLRPGSSVLGKCVVNENCTISAGSLLLDRDLQKNSIYIGNPKSYTRKNISEILPVWNYSK